MQRSPIELAELRAQTDYVHDDAGRLLCINDIGRPAAPWALVVRTAVGSLVRLRHDAPPKLRDAVHAFAESLEPLRVEQDGPDGALDDLVRVASHHVHVSRTSAGPAFTFPEPLFPSLGAAQIYPANAVLLHPALAPWGPELAQRRPAFGVFRGRQAIAICASSRLSPGAAEAGVETAPEFRGQGAAVLATMAWASAVREAGKVPFYSTSWDNAASRAVARKLDLELFAEDLWVA